MKIEQTKNGKWQLYGDDGKPYGEPQNSPNECRRLIADMQQAKPKAVNDGPK